MRGKRAKQIRKAAGGQEITTERKYGYVPVEKDQKGRIYNIEEIEVMDGLGKTKLIKTPHVDKLNGARNFKLAPLVSMSEGRRRVKALKKHFYEMSRAS